MSALGASPGDATTPASDKMATKVTSLGSTSGAPTPPNATPRTEASVSIDNIPHTDLNAVGRILGTVQEDLNESADAAMYPSPPINTPEAFSPAPSVYRQTRGRGLSAIGDRLAQLKLEERISPRKDTDVTSSNRSIVASIEEDDENEQDDDGASSALGSPSSNPRIHEYLSFTSNDLPVTSPNKPDTSSTLAAPVLHSRENSIKSVKSDGAVSGVTEKSTWAEEVEDAAKRTVQQLEQLAMDEYKVDDSKTIDDYYVARLQRLLSAPDRQIKVTVSKKTKDGE